MAKHLLTDRHVRNAKLKAKAYRLADGEGLYLFIPPTGAAAWQYRYRLHGKQQTATLGKLSSMTLAAARTEANRARGIAAGGDHLTVAKRVRRAHKAAAAAATFGVLAASWIKSESRRRGWTPDYRDEVAASLKNHLRVLDDVPIAAISAAVAATPLRRAEAVAPDMAQKVRQRLRAILDMAVEDGLIAGNPIPASRRTQGASRERRHMAAVLDHDGVGEILRAADKAECCKGVRRAHLLAAFTAQRIGEIVPAEWAEVDLTAATWTIPRARMKRKDPERGPHVVPIPPKLLAELSDWRRADGEGARFVCPAPRGDNSITREAVEKFYRRTLKLTGKHSPHSWRSVFSTWARDAGKSGDVVESQLDHVVGNKVASAYDQAQRVELRRTLVTWHESVLLTARDNPQVPPIKRGVRT